MTLAELARLESPKGWKFRTKPTLRTRGSLELDLSQAIGNTETAINERFTTLVAWAKTNKIGLVPQEFTWLTLAYDQWYVPTVLRVSINKPDTTDEFFAPSSCLQGCGHKLEGGALSCTKCGAKQRCHGCEKIGITIHGVKSVLRNRHNFLCGDCAPVCTTDDCAIRVWKAEYGKQFSGQCSTHMPVTRCPSCSTLFEKEKGKSCIYREKETVLCPTCTENYVCVECGTYSSTVHRSPKKLCKVCLLSWVDEAVSKHTAWDKSELPKGGSLVIPDLPERPYRVVSIETELNGNKDTLAGVLYRCGLVASPEVQAYHTNPDTTLPWAAHLKHDGSVSGGELIFHCMSLDTQQHADVLLETLSKLRGLSKVDEISCGKECGGHIHIDAHNFGYGDVWRLITIWNYLEDVIYRLAGAGHDYSHRVLAGRYAPQNGRGYASSTIKGPFGSKALATQSVQGQQRHSGLNFVPYVQAQELCKCGAFSRGDGDGRNCSCDLGKRTIEWRVWNTQINPRILHGWLAFMQAVMAYCDTGEDPSATWEDDFPSTPFTWAKYSTKQDKTTKARLEWIFKNLVLTDDERDSLVYAFKQSELKTLGTEFLNSLLKIIPANAFPAKTKVVRRAIRRTPIKVTPPTPKVKAKAAEQVLNAQEHRLEWANQLLAVQTTAGAWR